MSNLSTFDELFPERAKARNQSAENKKRQMAADKAAIAECFATDQGIATLGILAKKCGFTSRNASFTSDHKLAADALLYREANRELFLFILERVSPATKRKAKLL